MQEKTEVAEGMTGVTQEKKDTLLTEEFITSYLLRAEDGLIRTNFSNEEGADLFLSESLGLWMEYLVFKQDDVQFEQAFQTLQQQFLNDEQLVRWKVEKESKTEVNALIDDLRIIEALFLHGENTGHDGYVEQAKQMAESLYTLQQKDHMYVDFYDVEHGYANDELTLSYILLGAFKEMESYGVITEKEWDDLYAFAKSIPFENHFYPKSYNVEEKEFSYDTTVNVIDQLYIALHFERFDIDTNPFFTWMEEAYEQDGKLYGRYDAMTKENEVTYESAAVYALAIMYSMERGETELARDLYTSMVELREDNETSPYVGGYVYTNEQGNTVTHSFDNLLPLLAERKLRDEQIVQ